MKFNLKIFLLIPLVLISCQSYFEPIINEAAEKAVKEYGNSNPLAERVLEVEKIVEVPVEKIVEVFVEVGNLPEPTQTPVPIIKKSKSEIDQFFECKESDEYCMVALGKKNNDLVVTGNTSYEIELYFTSGYDPSKLIVSVDFCYPIMTKCWTDSGSDGY